MRAKERKGTKSARKLEIRLKVFVRSINGKMDGGEIRFKKGEIRFDLGLKKV